MKEKVRSRSLSRAAAWLAGVAALALPLAANCQQSRDLLLLRDGSALHGSLRSVNASGDVQWRHPASPNSISFSASSLRQIRLAGPKSSTQAPDQTCRFRFHNGDEILGQLISLDSESVELETGFAGRVKAPRRSLQSLSFLHSGFSMIYEGPDTPSGWRIGPVGDAWVYEDGAFVAQGIGFLGRDLGLPDQARVEFDLEWQGQLALIASIFTDAVDRFDFNASSYMLYIGGNVVTVQRVQAGVGQVRLGQAEIPDLLTKSKVRIELRADRKRNLLALRSNGNPIALWEDPAGFASSGRGISFYSQRAGAPVRISHIKVSQWDSRWEDAAPDDAGGAYLKLANHDKMTGEVKAIRDGKVTVATARAALDIPLDRVTQIILPREGKDKTPGVPAAGVQAHFSGGDTMLVQFENWNDQIIARSPNFGRLALRADWLRRLVFDPDGTGPQTLDTDLFW